MSRDKEAIFDIIDSVTKIMSYTASIAFGTLYNMIYLTS